MSVSQKCRLYAITPPQFELSEFILQVEEALAAGDIACLQLRLKEASDEEIREAAKALIPICHSHGTAFMVNDSVEIALEVGADGVHLGQEDLEGTSVKAIADKLPEGVILGVTCHASNHLAMEAGEQGAAYVAFGAFYETTSKPKEKLEKWGTPTTELLEGWTQFTTIPSVAIGGITPDNCKPLVQAGADFIAVITGIWDHAQGAGAGVRAYNAAIQEALAAAAVA
ncbi:MAG: thiamine phosphate synthase [Rickettsiales bacterium]|nr:thiamine phosphate synthase [Rickettsiales bacterium]